MVGIANSGDAAGIGRSFGRGRRAWAALAVGAAAVALDLWLPWAAWSSWLRLGTPVVALAAFAALGGWDRVSLGLVARPRQGWRYWAKVTLALGALMVAGITAVGAGAWLLGVDMPEMPKIPDLDYHLRHLWVGVVVAPLIEEPVYRFALCTPAIAAIGRWPAIALSGIVFGFLHVVYGVAAPDNLIAGFALGWAYFHAGTLLVPVLLHALGNLCVVGAQLAWSFW